MFLKKSIGGTKSNPIVYLQLCQSYRDANGKPRHRILCTLGREDEVISMADALAKKFARISEKIFLVEKSKEFLGSGLIFGPILVLEALWKELNLCQMLNIVKGEYKIEFDLNKAVKLMVLNRLCDPKSKLSISEWKENLFSEEFKRIDLQHLYRSLDILSSHRDFLLKKMYEKSRNLFKAEVSMVFYDLTTIYFESQKEDLMRRYGYSKENKTDCVQVVIGMVISKDDIPLYYEIFPGNTYEGKSVHNILKVLKEKFEIEKVIFIGDKGLLSNGVLKEIEDLGLEYIVSAKISKIEKEYKEEIIKREGMKEIKDGLFVKGMEVRGRRLIVGYSEERAKRDRFMREELLKKLKEKITKDAKGIIAKNCYKSYLEIKTEKIEISEKKVKEKEKLDGYFGYFTNNRELSEEEVIKAYKMLWQIEDSFRCLKSSLDVRPLYHYTKSRIEGHLMMCFISFYIMRIMQKKLKSINISSEKAIENLKKIQAIEIRTENQKVYARTEITGLNNDILRLLKIKIPQTILKEENVVE